MPVGVTKLVRIRAFQGLVLAAGIAASAYKLSALSGSGAVAATVVGTAVYAGMGIHGSVTMVSYFASSSAFGRLPGRGHSGQQRGNRRDAVQVLANGGPAAAFSLLHAWSLPPVSDLMATAFFGSLAAATADTLATEVGTRWGGLPRNIVTGRPALPGESGAVTPIGLVASTVASLAIAALAQPGSLYPRTLAPGCVAGGVTGSVADSLLGALVQEQRWCERCGARTELTIHGCGRSTRHVAGIPTLNNDVVNAMGVMAGGLTAAVVSAALLRLTACIGSRVEFAPTLTNSPLPRNLGAA